MKRKEILEMYQDGSTDFSGMDLSDIEFKAGDDLSGASFLFCDLSDTDFTDCILDDCDFRGATLNATNFEGASLTDANFKNTNTESALFDEDVYEEYYV